MRDNPDVGVQHWNDFTDFPITAPTTEGNWGTYSAFSDTGGTILPEDTIGGGVAIGSDGDNEGASFRTYATPFKISQSTKRFWFECRIKTSTIADTKHNIFVGLYGRTAITTAASVLSAVVPITAAGAIGDVNCVGFRRTEATSGGPYVDTVYKADGVTAVTVQSQGITLVADTYMKLGMFYEPIGDVAGNYALSFYYNGTRLSTAKVIPSAAGTDFPNDVNMGLVFAVLNATGTTPGTSTMDWWRAAQLF